MDVLENGSEYDELKDSYNRAALAVLADEERKRL
jgi:hypothetical protein